MSVGKKRALIAAAILISVGILMAGISFCAMEFDFTKLNTDTFEEYTLDVSGDFTHISVECDEETVRLLPSADGTGRLECRTLSKVRCAAEVRNGTLTVFLKDERKWYDHFFTAGNPVVTVYLPEGDYGRLTVKNSTGNVEIPSGYTFETAEVSTSTGSIRFTADAKELQCRVSTGSITAENVKAREVRLTSSTGRISVMGTEVDGDMLLKASTGSVTIADSSAARLLSAETSTGKVTVSRTSAGEFRKKSSTGETRLEEIVTAGVMQIESDTGHVFLVSCDAAEIRIETDTGDVTADFLSPKMVFAKSDTGRINVPESLAGGKCSIKTDTGDIKVTFQE